MEEKVHDTHKLRIFTGVIVAVLIGSITRLWEIDYRGYLKFEDIARCLSMSFAILTFFFAYLRPVSIACAILSAGLLCASSHLTVAAIVWSLFLIAYALLSQNIKLRCVLAIIACAMYIGGEVGYFGVNGLWLINSDIWKNTLLSCGSWLYDLFFIDILPAICVFSALSSCAIQLDDALTTNKPLRASNKQAVAALETLEKYAALKEQGILTDEEFETQKQSLIEQI